MEQIILSADNNYKELDNYLKTGSYKTIFIVCGNSAKEHKIYNFFQSLSDINKIYFSDFTANPKYEEVCKGVELFNQHSCDLIVALGGGSAMDVAKCIKLFSNMNKNENYLSQEIIENGINILAIPTTAGTGSETTRYAVIYYNGEKQSITHDSIIPNAVLFDPSFLETLPEYQKKSTFFDALSHSFESYWSVNSTDESKEYSKQAIIMLDQNVTNYLNGDIDSYEKMLKASYLAGKAINITQTTAGHALCYKLTSLYSISHGHAAALVNSCLLPFMLNNINQTVDQRGIDYVKGMFVELENIVGKSLNDYFDNLLNELNMYNVSLNKKDIEKLTDSVNLTRLKNNPIILSRDDIYNIYEDLFNKVEKRQRK